VRAVGFLMKRFVARETKRERERDQLDASKVRPSLGAETRHSGTRHPGSGRNRTDASVTLLRSLKMVYPFFDFLCGDQAPGCICGWRDKIDKELFLIGTIGREEFELRRVRVKLFGCRSHSDCEENTEREQGKGESSEG
jgi:hypothetical protein